MFDPVISTADMNTYERYAILEHIDKNGGVSPLDIILLRLARRVCLRIEI